MTPREISKLQNIKECQEYIRGYRAGLLSSFDQGYKEGYAAARYELAQLTMRYGDAGVYDELNFYS